MGCGKCGCGKGTRLCPISFGLALGLTFGLAVFFWAIWVMHYGFPAVLVGFHLEPLNWTTSIIYSLFAFLKGFIFGVVIALFYDLFACCCKCRACCKKSPDASCGCSCCSTTSNTIRK